MSIEAKDLQDTPMEEVIFDVLGEFNEFQDVPNWEEGGRRAVARAIAMVLEEKKEKNNERNN